MKKDGSMSKPATETLSVVVEREVPFPPDKVWRGLTEPQLIEKWLMKNDFKPVVDHAFTLRAEIGALSIARPSRNGEALSGTVTDRSACLFCGPGSRFAWPG
jgi:uncharacterized protein YndB with AHSA1/START domain